MLSDEILLLLATPEMGNTLEILEICNPSIATRVGPGPTATVLVAPLGNIRQHRQHGPCPTCWMYRSPSARQAKSHNMCITCAPRTAMGEVSKIMGQRG